VNADAVTVSVDLLGTGDDAPRALVANLPYSVAATVVLRFFEEMPSIQRAVVMVQAEVADRMAAVPGTKAYGAYTVKLALRAQVTDRFPVPRTCFLPPPRVDSSVICLERTERGSRGASWLRAGSLTLRSHNGARRCGTRWRRAWGSIRRRHR